MITYTPEEILGKTVLVNAKGENDTALTTGGLVLGITFGLDPNDKTSIRHSLFITGPMVPQWFLISNDNGETGWEVVSINVPHKDGNSN